MNLFSGNISNLLNTATRKRKQPPPDSGASILQRATFLPLDAEEYSLLDAECSAAKAKYDEAHAHAHHLYKEWMQERDRYFCVHCFKPMFLDVLVERLKGIAGSIISDINKMQEDKP